MGRGFAKMMKQARLLQQELQALECTGKAGGDLVTIVVSGERELKSVKIHPDCVDPKDVEGLEDLIVQAYQNAIQQVDNHFPT